MVARVLSALKDMYGDDIPDPVDAVVYKWDEDEFSKGSYGYLPPGGIPDDMRLIGEPLPGVPVFVDRETSTYEQSKSMEGKTPPPSIKVPLPGFLDHCLYFGGEATSIGRLGFSDGAYEAGLREADRIFNQYLSKLQRSKL